MNFNSNSFRYGAHGRRTGKTISSATPNYLYDGSNIVQELSGPTVPANLLSGGIDEVFTRTEPNGFGGQRLSWREKSLTTHWQTASMRESFGWLGTPGSRKKTRRTPTVIAPVRLWPPSIEAITPSSRTKLRSFKANW